MSAPTLDQARAAKEHARTVFAPLGNVVGIGITRIGAGFGVKVNLREAPAAGVSLPGEVHGVPVEVEVVGPISKR